MLNGGGGEGGVRVGRKVKVKSEDSSSGSAHEFQTYGLVPRTLYFATIDSFWEGSI